MEGTDNLVVPKSTSYGPGSKAAMSRPNVNSTVYGWELNALVNKDSGSSLLRSYGMKSRLITRGNNVSTPGAHRYSHLPPHISWFLHNQAGTYGQFCQRTPRKSEVCYFQAQAQGSQCTPLSFLPHGDQQLSARRSVIQSPWGKSPRGAPTRWKSLSEPLQDERPAYFTK